MDKNKKWKSQFIIVALGQAVSMLGSHGVQFALIWWLAEKTSSPLMLGISFLFALFSKESFPLSFFRLPPSSEHIKYFSDLLIIQ